MNFPMRRWAAVLVLSVPVVVGSAGCRKETPSATGADAPAVPPPLAIDAPGSLPNLFPEGTLLYVAWPGIDRLSATSQNTALAKMLKEPEVVRFREQLRTQVWPAVDRMIAAETDRGGRGGMSWAALTVTLRGVLATMWKYPTALGLAGVGIGEQGPQVDAAIIVRAGGDATKLVDALDSLVRQAKTAGAPVGETKDVTVAGATLKELSLPEIGLPLRWGVIGSDFVLALGDKVTAHLAAGGEAKGLGQSERFAAAMRATGGSTSTPTFFLDLKGVVTTLETFQPMLAGVPVVGEPGGLRKTLDTLGLGTVQSASVVMAPEADGFKTSFFLHAPGLGAGTGSVLDQEPLTDRDLAVVPKDASWASVWNFDLHGFYKKLLGAISAVAPAAQTEILGAIAEAEKEIGVKIEDELLASFGDTWAIFDAPSQGGFWFTGITLVVEVKQGNQLDQTLRKIVGVIAEAAKDEAQVSVQSEEHRGQTIRFVNVAGAPMPIAPAWAEYEGRCIIALYPQMVRATLDHLMDGSASLLDNPDFQRGMKLMPANAYSISYVDTKAGVRQLYALALPAAQVLVAMGQAKGIPIDVSAMPAAPTITKHLFGNVGATAATKEGVLVVSHGALPAAIPAFGEGGTMAPLLTAILLPSLARARHQARRVVSASNLHQIGLALTMYSMDNRGQLPTDLEAVVEKYLRTKEVLKSPLDDSGDEISYIFVLGGQKPDRFRRASEIIMVYEKPEDYDGEGTNVLFADGHVAFTKMDVFESKLEQTKQEIERLNR